LKRICNGLSTNSETKKGDLIDVLFNGSVYKNDAEKVLV
jgi:hypothetical protein